MSFLGEPGEPDRWIHVRTMSEVGGSESAKTEHPNREVVSSRPCVRARSVIHAESEMKWLSGRLAFSLLPLRVLAFPFSLQDLSVGACLSKSEQI